MNANPEKSITIKWQMSLPPALPSSWHNWGQKPTIRPEHQGLEANLGLPAGTLAYVEHAFSEGLNRFQGWELDWDDAAATMAASLYKRGVHLRSPAQSTVPEEISGSYSVNLYSEKTSLSGFVSNDNSCFYVIDEEVLQGWPELDGLNHSYTVTASEISKTLSTAEKITEASKKFSGITHWCIIGGGVVSDVAAFAAGMAQTPFSFVPTTLLAMADACVGGKTGVNYPPYGKNQLGLFRFPESVLVWPGWFQTLPRRQLLAGACECLKHAFLAGDFDLAETLVTTLQKRVPIDPQILAKVIEFKADVVAEDPGENGKRAILNFGHTLGHALEAYSHSRSPEDYLLHGEAVGLGMLFAAELSKRAGTLTPQQADRIQGLLALSDCLISRPRLEEVLVESDLDRIWPDLYRLILNDKKRLTDKSNWVLLDSSDADRTKSESYLTEVELSQLEKTWDAFLKKIPKPT